MPWTTFKEVDGWIFESINGYESIRIRKGNTSFSFVEEGLIGYNQSNPIEIPSMEIVEHFIYCWRAANRFIVEYRRIAPLPISNKWRFLDYLNKQNANEIISTHLNSVVAPDWKYEYRVIREIEEGKR